MRLLHAGHRDEPVRALPRGEPATRAERQRGSSPATSAAAPAIGRSSRRRWRPATARRPTVSRRRPSAAPRRSPRSPTSAICSSATSNAFFAAPASEASLAALYARHPDAVLLGGATDVGLWITKQLRDLKKIIWLGRVAGLDAIEERRGRRSTSARRRRLHDAMPQLAALHPDLGEIMRRFGSAQVRVERHGRRQYRQRLADRRSRAGADRARRAASNCARARRRANLPLEDFFIAYGKQDRAPGEYVRALDAPRLQPNERLSRLQSVQALRRGHFGCDERVPLHARRAADRRGAHRLRRHGGDAQTRARAPKRRWSARASTIPRAGAPPSRRSARISRR